MKRNVLMYSILAVFLFLAAGTAAVSADDTATGQVAVTSLTMDPEVLMPGDTAIVTATVKNSGTTSVSIGRVLIMGVNEIYSSADKAYSTVGMLGPGDTMTFTFPIKSNGATGTFYPTLYIDFLDAGLNSLKYTFPVQVDDTQLSVALIDQPDAFGQSRNEQVTLRIGNPRANTLNGIEIIVTGDGVSSKQTAYFVGKLEPDQYVDAELTVVVDQPTDISFDVTYRNGQNLHENSVGIPVELGERKVRAEMILNNIEIKNSGSYYTISGDVNNAGLEDAKSVTVTTAKATASEPYKSYVVGSLEPDGLAEFEVTFTNPEGNTVELVVDYKDDDGNSYQETVEVSVGSATAPAADGAAGTAAKGNTSTPFGTIIAVIAVAAVAVCAAVAWKRGLLSDLRK